MSFGNDLRNTFTKNDNGLIRLIVVNAIVFVVANLISLFYNLESWLALPSDISLFLSRPWTIITYMFYHQDIFHALFNMLWLYWMGILFVDFISSKRLVIVYLLGGIIGGLSYFLLAYIFSNTSLLLGASAAVMAVVVAIAAFIPNYSLNLLLIGSVQIKYIALVSFVITTLIDLNVNTGGKVSHIGGALFGLLFTTLYKQGKDITKPFTTLIDKISGKSNSNLKVAYKGKTNYQIKKEQEKTVDEILDKISKSGYESLTKEEKEILFKASGKG